MSKTIIRTYKSFSKCGNLSAFEMDWTIGITYFTAVKHFVLGIECPRSAGRAGKLPHAHTPNVTNGRLLPYSNSEPNANGTVLLQSILSVEIDRTKIQSYTSRKSHAVILEAKRNWISYTLRIARQNIRS